MASLQKSWAAKHYNTQHTQLISNKIETKEKSNVWNVSISSVDQNRVLSVWLVVFVCVCVCGQIAIDRLSACSCECVCVCVCVCVHL